MSSPAYGARVNHIKAGYSCQQIITDQALYYLASMCTGVESMEAWAVFALQEMSVSHGVTQSYMRWLYVSHFITALADISSLQTTQGPVLETTQGSLSYTNTLTVWQSINYNTTTIYNTGCHKQPADHTRAKAACRPHKGQSWRPHKITQLHKYTNYVTSSHTGIA